MSRMHASRIFGVILIAAAVANASAQPVATPASALHVDFGDTALVAQPCPPMPGAVSQFLAAPVGTPPTADAIKGAMAWSQYEQANDWPGLCRYHDDDQQVRAGPSPDVVFMGDSITESWRRADPAFFTPGRIDRGVSGQTTPQMLARFYQDVIALHPRVVHIMAGTNDLAGNTGATSEEAFKNNIAAMVDLAEAHGIAVVLASIPPSDKFAWRPALKPAAEIVALNRWLVDFARQRGLIFVDYTPALATPSGGLRSDLSPDGVHPNKAGYALIEPLALKAIARAEKAGSRASQVH
jgi:lysophospholipase L1-like esterase